MIFILIRKLETLIFSYIKDGYLWQTSGQFYVRLQSIYPLFDTFYLLNSKK